MLNTKKSHFASSTCNTLLQGRCLVGFLALEYDTATVPGRGPVLIYEMPRKLQTSDCDLWMGQLITLRLIMNGCDYLGRALSRLPALVECGEAKGNGEVSGEGRMSEVASGVVSGLVRSDYGQQMIRSCSIPVVAARTQPCILPLPELSQDESTFNSFMNRPKQQWCQYPGMFGNQNILSPFHY